LHPSQQSLLLRRLALLEVELALFLLRLIELELIPRRFGLLAVELAEVLPCLMDLRRLPKRLGLSVPMQAKAVSILT
jgi:hypothetical protein